MIGQKKVKFKMSPFLIGGGLGLLTFLLIYGIAVLNFTNTDWLLTGADLTQHQLGWEFFRNSDWHAHIGLLDGLLEPYSISIVYTDSIPLFALFFKVLSPILPESFQYFGLFGLMTFFLNGALGAVLANHFVRNRWLAGLSSIFFILSPPILQRLYGYLYGTGQTRHTSLAAHFILYAAILLWLNADKLGSLRKTVLYWSLLCVLCVLIQSYFLPFVLCIMGGYLLEELIKNHDWKRCLARLGAACVSVLAVMWILGCFVGNPSSKNIGYGFYSSDLSSLYNPLHYSSIFPDKIPIGGGAYEGFGYLGAGMLLLAGIALIAVLIRLIKKEVTLPALWKKYGLRAKIVFLVILIFWALALTTTCAWNGKVLFQIDLPQSVLEFMGIVRSSGRFIWGVMYFVMLIVLFSLSKSMKKTILAVVLSLCVVIQVVDLSGVMKNLHYIYAEQAVAKLNTLPSDAWDELLEEYDGVSIILNTRTTDSFRVTMSFQQLFSLGEKVANHNSNMDYFYLSRPFPGALERKARVDYEVLMEGKARDNILYILPTDRLEQAVQNSTLKIYVLDGLAIATKNTIRINNPNIAVYRV